MMAFINALTNSGDLAVLLPLVAVIALWLHAIRQLVALVWWLGAFALCTGSTAVLKVYFFVCPPVANLHSPSGHTSLSTLVYGALTLAVAAAFTGWPRYAVIAAGTGFIAGIGISRVLVQAHSIPEVVLGSLIGLVALALFGNRFWRHRPEELRLMPLIMACALLMALLNGQNLRAEDLLRAIGIYLQSGMACF